VEEKKGGSIVRDLAREWVEDIMLDWDLEDIKPSRGKFTWTNKRVGLSHIIARLDRFLVQNSFLLLGLNFSSKIMSHSVSDHKPILLELSRDENLGPIPFRFSPAWLLGFQASRGLKQGCPLSPLLYVIQASVLSFQLDYGQLHNNLMGLRIAPGIKDINHAQFANDTLLLGGASVQTTG
jgi:hypothetical protein